MDSELDVDDELTLPDDTLKILEEFLKAKEKSEEAGHIEEDWQLSQFWYNRGTKRILQNMCLLLNEEYKEKNLGWSSLHKDFRVGLLSCPSLYTSVKEVCDNVKIFEYDQRFSTFGDDFQHYDYNLVDQKKYLKEYDQTFDLIIADPPFLSEECIEKMAVIIKKLIKPDGKIVFNSGIICKDWIEKYMGLEECVFKPQHERNLANEFTSFANFNLDDYVFKP